MINATLKGKQDIYLIEISKQVHENGLAILRNCEAAYIRYLLVVAVAAIARHFVLGQKTTDIGN